ncbi:WD repeat-containing protein 64 [Acropora cervicornis]|uniref:WD repeat-containing protein 64 n=1 Tax=Acropora cervicornis TaxID=6130 RepID=A0AAD9VAL4_ACRCE|nr:WD repeat-containing protein 64 [Acropora cervicornis]
MFSRQSSRPYTVGSFQAKLALFEQFIQEFTYVDEELNPEERQQILQARYEPFCEAIRGLFGNDVSTQDLKALFRKIALNPDAQVDWSELFGIGGSTDEVPDLLLNEDTSSVITTSKRRSMGEAGGDKKRRDVVKSIVHVPKYDFYIIASQKGIICQWSSRVTSERAVSLWDYRVKRKQLTIYQVKPMENSPQCMTYIPWKTDSINEDTILFGDDQGYINLMILTSKDLHMKNSTGKTDSQFVAIEPNKLSYPVRELGVPKGVNCFDYCTKANVIITAGADKVIRVWHPLIFTRPTGKLLGHLFTIVDVAVNEKDQQLISLSTARVFRVWDIQTLSCLQVFTDNEIRPGEKRISCMLFDSKHDRLITGCSVIDTWPLTRAIQDSLQVPHTHDRPICQLLYNPQMNQVMSGDAEGMLKVWEMETGQFVYQVSNAHGSSTEITAMTVDSSGYRLATGAYNGSIKVWDFGSGQLYKMFPEEQAKVKHEDTITGLAFCTIQNKRCLLVSAWGRKIRIMEDPADVAILVEFKDLSDLFIPTAPSRTNKDEELPFISRTSLPTIGESQEIRASNEASVLSECEVTSIELVPPLLFAGTTSGAIVMWHLETQKIVLSNKVKFEASNPETSNHEQYQESKGSEENDEKDGEVSNDEEEGIVQRSEEEENKDVEIKGKDELMASEAGEDEEIEDKADNLDKTGKEDITDVDKDAILGAFLQVSEPGLVSAHHDGFLRFWDLSVRAVTRRQASAVTCMCTDADCNFVISGDARGYITVWEVGNFLLHRPTVNSSGEHQGDENVHSKELETKKEPKNVIKQVVCWRGHLTRVVGVEHVQSSEVIVSASTDCSVRVWYRNTGHFIGFFSQPRLWHLPSAKSVPSTPVRPYDISEGPIKTLKSVANTKAVHKITEAAQKETKAKGDNKKFFDSLSKPKHYNSHLESSSVGSPDTGAVYRALPVYRVDTPERLKTPAINMQSSWLTNQSQNYKGAGNKSTFVYRSSSSTREPVVSRFPHIVQGHKR